MEAPRGRIPSTPQRDPGPADETLTILANVEWIVARLDQRGLAEVDDVPILELAKHISVERPAA